MWIKQTDDQHSLVMERTGPNLKAKVVVDKEGTTKGYLMGSGVLEFRRIDSDQMCSFIDRLIAAIEEVTQADLRLEG